MKKPFYINILFCLLITTIASSQVIPFKNYTVKKGLPSNVIYDIQQDNKGYMWLATQAGLVKFDGYSFENYTIENGLMDNYVRALLVDNEDNIWAGTEVGGISVINGASIKNISANDGLFAAPVDKLFIDSTKNVWACGLEDGVSIIKKDTIITFNGENSMLKSNIFCHFVDSKGVVWLGNYDGVFYYDTAIHHLDHPQLKNLIVWDIIEDQYNRIWIASQEHGVFCFDGEVVIRYDKDSGLSTNSALSLLEDKQGRILVGTYYGGIQIIENSIIKTDYIKETEDFWIWELFEDSKNRVWARTQEQGVVLIRDKKINSYSKKNNLVSPTVLNLSEDSYGNIWFATLDGFSIYGKAFFENYKDGFIADDRQILSLLISKNNTIYTGSYNGLTVIEPGHNIKEFTKTAGIIEDVTVGKIIETTNSEIWLGTVGLSRLKNGIIEHFIIPEMDFEGSQIIPNDMAYYKNYIYAATEIGLLVFNTKTKDYIFLDKEDGLIDNDLYSLAIDSYGNIWCGSSGGLSVFDGNEFYNFSEKDGLPNNFCNDICFDNNGIAWIATDYGICSATLSKNYTFSCRNYSLEDGLKSNSIVSIISDNENNLWLGHNEGIDCFVPKTKITRNYGVNDGFLPLENILGSITKDSQGNIWFGTNDGVVKYSPKYDTKNIQPPKVFISGIKLYNDTSSVARFYTELDSTTLLPKDLSLHYSKKNLYFTYVGLHYTIVEKNTYKYRLLGYEENWSELTTETQSIPYQKLPHGEYTFQVMAANCDGVWTKEAAEFSFEILPPFWKTWWFRIFEIIAGIVLLYVIIYLRERKLRYDKQVLTQKVEERTIEVVKQKDLLAEQRDEIINQKKEITDSIQYAQHIQSAILPKDETILPLLKDYFILYKPRDIVSGDFYWVYGNDTRVIVIAADCTGHGVPGAFMSMLGVSILNEIATKNNTITAGEILDTLREHIISTLSHTSQDQEAHDGMDLALSIINYNTYKIQYAGAFNPLILIRNGEIEVVKASKMPVGSHGGKIEPFESKEIDIQKNDCIYMFSDGYADQFGGPRGKKFMSKRFKELLVENYSKTMSEQHKILDDTIEEWKNGQEQIDDILVMGIRVV